MGLTRGPSPPPGGRESAEPAATAGQYADWRGYKKGHGRVSPEVRRGMEQQQYRGQQSREPEQAVAVIRDTVVHDTSQKIEAMKSDVDRMLQQARRPTRPTQPRCETPPPAASPHRSRLFGSALLGRSCSGPLLVTHRHLLVGR